MYYDVVLKEDYRKAPLTENEMVEMKNKMWDPEAFVLDIEGSFTAASGFASSYLSEEKWKDMIEVEKYVKQILDNYRLEREDHSYECNGVSIYLSR